MRSSVESFMPYKEIPIPEDCLTVEIPSWDAVVQPTIDVVINEYNDLTQSQEVEITDEMVEIMPIDNVNTVYQLKQYAMTLFQKNQKQYKFYHEILPFILTFYHQFSVVVFNSEEKEAYLKKYIQQIEQNAESVGLTLENYAMEYLEISGDIKNKLITRGEEDFVFKLIAQKIFKLQGGQLDEESYERFIQRNVLHRQADEIEIREQFPYHVFVEMMPEMSLTQDLFDYFSERIRFVIQQN